MNNFIKKRILLERYVIQKKYLFNKNNKLKFIRGWNNRIIPPNIFQLTNCSKKNISKEQKVFSILSKCIRKNKKGERNKVEKEISKILKLDKKTSASLISNSFRKFGIKHTLFNYGKNLDYKIPKKKVINRLINLLNKFSELSDSEHYRLTHNEKSMIKRINKKVNNKKINKYN